MAVQGVKGSGIGQVTIPSAADYLREREGYVSGIGAAAAPYMQGLIEGEGPMAQRYMPSLGPAEEFRKKVGLPPATTRSEQLGDFIANIPLYGLEGIRRATGVIGDAPAIIGDFLASPTDAAMAQIIAEEAPEIEAQLSPFREQARLMGQEVPPMTERDETQKAIDDLTESMTSDKARSQAQAAATDAQEQELITSDEAKRQAELAAAEADVAGATETAQDPYEAILKQAMDNVASIRGEDPKGTLEDYKKEFADATGVDISGKVDKSHALMALGLSLMQNKAGRGFNVSSALSALGEAGEKAMPAFAKAKSEAKAAQVAAGKFALGELSKDEQAKAVRLAAAQKTVDEILKQRQTDLSKSALEQEKHYNAMELQRLENKGKVAAANAGKEAKSFEYTGEKAYTPLGSKPEIKLHIANVKADGREVFTKPQSDAAMLAKGYADSLDGIASIDKAINLVTEIGEEGVTLSKAKGAVDNFFKATGIKGYETELSKATQLDAVVKTLISKYKRFLTQETGNGISNQDIDNLMNSLGKLDFFTNPQEAIERLNETKGIFLSANDALERSLIQLTDKSMYLDPSVYDKVQETISEAAMGAIGLGSGALPTQTVDGVTVFKLS